MAKRMEIYKNIVKEKMKNVIDFYISRGKTGALLAKYAYFKLCLKLRSPMNMVRDLNYQQIKGSTFIS